MEEPFGVAMTMDEGSHDPQVLRSKGNEPVRGQGSRSGGSGVTGRHCKQAAGCWLERCGTGETADEGDGDGV